MIELSLKGQKLAVHTPLVVAGTVDYLTVQIHRDSPEWEGLSLHIFFQHGNRTYELLTDGDFIGTDAHLNLFAGEWSVSVVGYEFDGDEMVEKVTTNTIGLTVAPAPPDAGESLPDTPPSAFERVEAIARSVRDDADAGLFNGAKGDTGDQGPIGPCPDFSIGTVTTLAAGSDATASITGTDENPVLNLGIPKGDKGDKGDTGNPGAAGQDGTSITVSSNVTEYQEGSSGTTAPTESWTTTIPSVTAGNYLWTRVTTTFSDGTQAVSYSVARMGIDGSGSVATVNNVSPDGNGNVTLTASDVGAMADTYTAPVSSVNGKTGAVSLDASDVGALADTYSAPVDSVNSKTGTVILDASDVGALPITGGEVTGDTQFDADVEVDGVLDVTNRRAYATLSSAGWYRVLEYRATTDARAQYLYGVVFDFNIERGSARESHSISLRPAGDSGTLFVSEISVAETQYIDKIRHTYDSNKKAYVDIHLATASLSVFIGVDVSVHAAESDTPARITSSGLTAVADAPTGETIATTYKFANRTDYQELTVTRIENSYYNATDVGRIHAYARDNLLYILFNLAPSSNIPAGTTSFDIASIILPANRKLADAIYANIPSQSGNGTILMTVTTGGVIRVGNTTSVAAAGWTRGSFMAFLIPTT